LESNDAPHIAMSSIDPPFIFFTAIICMYWKNVSFNCKWQHVKIASTLGIKKMY